MFGCNRTICIICRDNVYNVELLCHDIIHKLKFLLGWPRGICFFGFLLRENLLSTFNIQSVCFLKFFMTYC